MLKSRFYQESNLRDRMEWYIRKTSCKGTLWEDRIKSLPVEGEGDSLVTMAACIELNPVRAGLAQDPKDYQLLLLRRRFGGRCGTPCGLDELLGTSGVGEGRRGISDATLRLRRCPRVANEAETVACREGFVS